MSDDIDLDDDPDEDGLYADEDQLELVGRFGASLGAIPWFSRVGARLEEREVREARGYLDALGFPDVDVARIASFADAAEAAASPDWDDPAWEAEEQLRAALTDDAVARIGAEALSVAMTHIAARAATSIDDKITRAAQLWDVEDDALLNAAKGAAIKAAHEAALVLLAGAEETHPFALKFRLFERGRWPVSVAGASFNLF